MTPSAKQIPSLDKEIAKLEEAKKLLSEEKSRSVIVLIESLQASLSIMKTQNFDDKIAITSAIKEKTGKVEEVLRAVGIARLRLIKDQLEEAIKLLPIDNPHLATIQKLIEKCDDNLQPAKKIKESLITEIIRDSERLLSDSGAIYALMIKDQIDELEAIERPLSKGNDTRNEITTLIETYKRQLGILKAGQYPGKTSTAPDVLKKSLAAKLEEIKQKAKATEQLVMLKKAKELLPSETATSLDIDDLIDSHTSKLQFQAGRDISSSEIQELGTYLEGKAAAIRAVEDASEKAIKLSILLDKLETTKRDLPASASKLHEKIDAAIAECTTKLAGFKSGSYTITEQDIESFGKDATTLSDTANDAIKTMAALANIADEIVSSEKKYHQQMSQTIDYIAGYTPHDEETMKAYRELSELVIFAREDTFVGSSVDPEKTVQFFIDSGDIDMISPETYTKAVENQRARSAFLQNTFQRIERKKPGSQTPGQLTGGALAILPVQRPPRYKLLFEDLLKKARVLHDAGMISDQTIKNLELIFQKAKTLADTCNETTRKTNQETVRSTLKHEPELAEILIANGFVFDDKSTEKEKIELFNKILDSLKRKDLSALKKALDTSSIMQTSFGPVEVAPIIMQQYYLSLIKDEEFKRQIIEIANLIPADKKTEFFTNIVDIIAKIRTSDLANTLSKKFEYTLDPAQASLLRQNYYLSQIPDEVFRAQIREFGGKLSEGRRKDFFKEIQAINSGNFVDINLILEKYLGSVTPIKDLLALTQNVYFNQIANEKIRQLIREKSGGFKPDVTTDLLRKLKDAIENNSDNLEKLLIQAISEPQEGLIDNVLLAASESRAISSLADDILKQDQYFKLLADDDIGIKYLLLSSKTILHATASINAAKKAAASAEYRTPIRSSTEYYVRELNDAIKSKNFKKLEKYLNLLVSDPTIKAALLKTVSDEWQQMKAVDLEAKQSEYRELITDPATKLIIQASGATIESAKYAKLIKELNTTISKPLSKKITAETKRKRVKTLLIGLGFDELHAQITSGQIMLQLHGSPQENGQAQASTFVSAQQLTEKQKKLYIACFALQKYAADLQTQTFVDPVMGSPYSPFTETNENLSESRFNLGVAFKPAAAGETKQTPITRICDAIKLMFTDEANRAFESMAHRPGPDPSSDMLKVIQYETLLNRILLEAKKPGSSASETDIETLENTISEFREKVKKVIMVGYTKALLGDTKTNDDKNIADLLLKHGILLKTPAAFKKAKDKTNAIDEIKSAIDSNNSTAIIRTLKRHGFEASEAAVRAMLDEKLGRTVAATVEPSPTKAPAAGITTAIEEQSQPVDIDDLPPPPSSLQIQQAEEVKALATPLKELMAQLSDNEITRPIREKAEALIKYLETTLPDHIMSNGMIINYKFLENIKEQAKRLAETIKNVYAFEKRLTALKASDITKLPTVPIDFQTVAKALLDDVENLIADVSNLDHTETGELVFTSKFAEIEAKLSQIKTLEEQAENAAALAASITKLIETRAGLPKNSVAQTKTVELATEWTTKLRDLEMDPPVAIEPGYIEKAAEAVTRLQRIKAQSDRLPELTRLCTEFDSSTSPLLSKSVNDDLRQRFGPILLLDINADDFDDQLKAIITKLDEFKAEVDNQENRNRRTKLAEAIHEILATTKTDSTDTDPFLAIWLTKLLNFSSPITEGTLKAAQDTLTQLKANQVSWQEDAKVVRQLDGFNDIEISSSILKVAEAKRRLENNDIDGAKRNLEQLIVWTSVDAVFIGRIKKLQNSLTDRIARLKKFKTDITEDLSEDDFIRQAIALGITVPPNTEPELETLKEAVSKRIDEMVTELDKDLKTGSEIIDAHGKIIADTDQLVDQTAKAHYDQAIKTLGDLEKNLKAQRARIKKYTSRWNFRLRLKAWIGEKTKDWESGMFQGARTEKVEEEKKLEAIGKLREKIAGKSGGISESRKESASTTISRTPGWTKGWRDKLKAAKELETEVKKLKTEASELEKKPVGVEPP